MSAARPGRRHRLRAPLAAAVVALGATAGCQRALFPENAPRTQYERYDMMRNRYTPAEEPDVFGKPRKALRARLSQPE